MSLYITLDILTFKMLFQNARAFYDDWGGYRACVKTRVVTNGVLSVTAAEWSTPSREVFVQFFDIAPNNHTNKKPKHR